MFSTSENESKSENLVCKRNAVGLANYERIERISALSLSMCYESEFDMEN